MERALVNKALPLADLPPTAQKPLMPKALRALVTAAFQPAMRLKAFFPAADFLADTMRPFLFFFKSDFFKPLAVLALVPLKTAALARLPFAITDFCKQQHQHILACTQSSSTFFYTTPRTSTVPHTETAAYLHGLLLHALLHSFLLHGGFHGLQEPKYICRFIHSLTTLQTTNTQSNATSLCEVSLSTHLLHAPLHGLLHGLRHCEYKNVMSMGQIFKLDQQPRTTYSTCGKQARELRVNKHTHARTTVTTGNSPDRQTISTSALLHKRETGIKRRSLSPNAHRSPFMKSCLLLLLLQTKSPSTCHNRYTTVSHTTMSLDRQ